jgi:hypothetical protein
MLIRHRPPGWSDRVEKYIDANIQTQPRGIKRYFLLEALYQEYYFRYLNAAEIGAVEYLIAVLLSRAGFANGKTKIILGRIEKNRSRVELLTRDMRRWSSPPDESTVPSSSALRWWGYRDLLTLAGKWLGAHYTLHGDTAHPNLNMIFGIKVSHAQTYRTKSVPSFGGRSYGRIRLDAVSRCGRLSGTAGTGSGRASGLARGFEPLIDRTKFMHSRTRAKSFYIESIVALAFWLSMIFSENRFPLFRIML